MSLLQHCACKIHANYILHAAYGVHCTHTHLRLIQHTQVANWVLKLDSIKIWFVADLRPLCSLSLVCLIREGDSETVDLQIKATLQ